MGKVMIMDKYKIKRMVIRKIMDII